MYLYGGWLSFALPRFQILFIAFGFYDTFQPNDHHGEAYLRRLGKSFTYAVDMQTVLFEALQLCYKDIL
jgi:hypothetical protein